MTWERARGIAPSYDPHDQLENEREVPHEEPLSVTAIDGVVIVDGPGYVALAFTAEAALETSKRMGAAAMAALAQQASGMSDA